MAMIFGWLVIVPPFIAMYNTARHVRPWKHVLGSSKRWSQPEHGLGRTAVSEPPRLIRRAAFLGVAFDR
jgi:hypothetical protein